MAGTYDLTDEQIEKIENAYPGVLGNPVCALDERLVFNANAAREAIDEPWIYELPDEKINEHLYDDGIYREWWRMLDELREELGPKEEEDKNGS